MYMIFYTHTETKGIVQDTVSLSLHLLLEKLTELSSTPEEVCYRKSLYVFLRESSSTFPKSSKAWTWPPLGEVQSSSRSM